MQRWVIYHKFCQEVKWSCMEPEIEFNEQRLRRLGPVLEFCWRSVKSWKLEPTDGFRRTEWKVLDTTEEFRSMTWRSEEPLMKLKDRDKVIAPWYSVWRYLKAPYSIDEKIAIKAFVESLAGDVGQVMALERGGNEEELWWDVTPKNGNLYHKNKPLGY